jgi:hypothetical protein
MRDQLNDRAAPPGRAQDAPAEPGATCDCITVTPARASALMTAPGSPCLIWHCGEARVVTAETLAARAREPGWHAIMRRDDLLATDPGAITCPAERLAGLLTILAQDILPAGCHQPGCPRAA